MQSESAGDSEEDEPYRGTKQGKKWIADDESIGIEGETDWETIGAL